MKKYLRSLLALLIAAMLLCCIAMADTGPKPSAAFTLTGMPDEDYYVTMLSEIDQYGPHHTYTEGEEIPGWVLSGGVEDPAYPIWQKFVDYADADGYYFLCDLFTQQHGDAEFGWAYYPPERFKLLLYFPESDVPAAEYYAALQAECDKGEHPELLTPLGAAKDFVANSGWYSDTPTDENVELTEGIDSDYSETNQRMSRVIASLLVRPGEVTDQEVLDCIDAFRNDTWGVMGRRFYGSDWWTPLQEALENAAVGDGQVDRDRSMMKFYLTSYGRYADFIGGLLQSQRTADSAAFQTVLEEFYPEQQSALLAAIA